MPVRLAANAEAPTAATAVRLDDAKCPPSVHDAAHRPEQARRREEESSNVGELKWRARRDLNPLRRKFRRHHQGRDLGTIRPVFLANANSVVFRPEPSRPPERSRVRPRAGHWTARRRSAQEQARRTAMKGAMTRPAWRNRLFPVSKPTDSRCQCRWPPPSPESNVRRLRPSGSSATRIASCGPSRQQGGSALRDGRDGVRDVCAVRAIEDDAAARLASATHPSCAAWRGNWGRRV
jgi:hypothetical protein